MKGVLDIPIKMGILAIVLFFASMYVGTNNNVGSTIGGISVLIVILSYYVACANIFDAGDKLSSVILSFIPIAPVLLISSITRGDSDPYRSLGILIGFVVGGFVFIKIISILRSYFNNYILKTKGDRFYIKDRNTIYIVAFAGIILGLVIALAYLMSPTAFGGVVAPSGTMGVSTDVSNTNEPSQKSASQCLEVLSVNVGQPEHFGFQKLSISPEIPIFGTVKNNCKNDVAGTVFLWAYDRNHNQIKGLFSGRAQNAQQIYIKSGETGSYSMMFDTRQLQGDAMSTFEVTVV